MARNRRGSTHDFTGQVALVTGAAQGIGAGVARALAARGARLVLLDVDAAALDALARELGPDVAVAAVTDVTDLAAVEDAVAQGVAAFGGIDLVLANAGIASYGSVLQVDPAAFRRVIDVNVVGVFHTVRAALPSVVERRGYVLVVSSLAAFTASPGSAAYNASKAGAENFANALRQEVAHLGVDVGSAHMCWIDTPLVRDAAADMATFDESRATLPGPLSRTVPLQDCVDAFVEGLAERRRRVWVPRWVGLLSAGRALLNSAAMERSRRADNARLVPKMDEEVRRLGRSSSARNRIG